MSEIPDHDRQLSRYRAYTLTAWCERCGEPTTIDFVEEYGLGSISPEECPDCGGELSLDPPAEPPDAA